MTEATPDDAGNFPTPPDNGDALEAAADALEPAEPEVPDEQFMAPEDAAADDTVDDAEQPDDEADSEGEVPPTP